MVYILQHLATELPSLLTLMVAIVAAVMLWRRAPTSSLCVALACGISFVLLIAYPFAWQVARHVAEGDPGSVRRVNIAFAVFWSVVRSVSTILLVLAVYLGRGATHAVPSPGLEPCDAHASPTSGLSQ
jgi:hypothetical protein